MQLANSWAAGAESVRVAELELTSPLPDIQTSDERTGRRYGRARLLVRLATEPLGFVDLALPTRPCAIAARVAERFGDELKARLAAVGATQDLTGGGLELRAEQVASLPWITGRQQVLTAAPDITVVICSRDRSAGLPAVIDAVGAQIYPRFDILVVDNAPRDEAVAAIVATSQARGIAVRRVVEPCPGLATARNCGLLAAAGTIVAYLDDDEEPDCHWLAEIARGFAAARDVAVVGGAILPRRIDTTAERLFELWGGHFKGRGFQEQIFDRASHRRQHPLFPLPPFVAGGNMAVDRRLLLRQGGFDTALGAGTPSRAGEDTAAVADLMLSGQTVVWRPSAFTYHSHYDTRAALERQLFGYGAGLGSFYARELLQRPSSSLTLARLAPRAFMELFAAGSLRNGGTNSGDLPTRLRAARRRGMAAGPYLYLRSRHQQHRLHHRPACPLP